MLTIPKNQQPRIGDYPCDCDYCGVRWMRSNMRLTGEGLLACPDESGLEGIECLDANRAMQTNYSIALDKDRGTAHEFGELDGDQPSDLAHDLFVAKYGREPGSELT